jgi:hypothetical protein
MDDPHFSYKQIFIKKHMFLNVKLYIGLVLGFRDKQEAIYIYFLCKVGLKVRAFTK